MATNGGVRLKRKLMAALSALEMVTIYGVGLNAIDLYAAARRGGQHHPRRADERRG